MHHTIRLMVLTLTFIGVGLADTLVLHDGRTFTGTMLGGDSRTIRFETAGQEQRFSVSSVARLSFDHITSAPSVPVENSASAVIPQPNSAHLNTEPVPTGTHPPTLISKVEAEYSDKALAACIEGNVRLAIVVQPDGLAHDIQIVRGLGSGLDEKAIEAVRLWQFRPGTKDGKAVSYRANVEVNFTYPSCTPTPAK